MANDRYKLPKLPSQYQLLEYIESNGSQYIDTGVKPQNKLDIKTDCMFLPSDGNQCIYNSQYPSNFFCFIRRLNNASNLNLGF